SYSARVHGKTLRISRCQTCCRPSTPAQMELLLCFLKGHTIFRGVLPCKLSARLDFGVEDCLTVCRLDHVDLPRFAKNTNSVPRRRASHAHPKQWAWHPARITLTSQS